VAKFDVDFHLDQEHLLKLLRPAFKFLDMYIQMREIEGEVCWELRSDSRPEFCMRVLGGLVDVGNSMAWLLDPLPDDPPSEILFPPWVADEAAMLARHIKKNLPEPLRPSPPLSRREIAMRRYLIRRGRRPK
jgi:hypothetical protein